MFGRRLTLFKLFGFEVRVDASWLILAILVTWSLARGLFPAWFKGLSEATYWGMALAGTAGLFLSIVLHEMSHSLVARRYGIPMKGITLFIFGGVAEMDQEPPSPRAEFLMALAGPLSSVALAMGFLLLATIGPQVHCPEPVTAVFSYLMWLNLVLAGFNLVPAFPLDGGRMLRAILWGAKHNIRWATRIASNFGAGFGVFLIIIGVFNFLGGNFIGGVWLFLIGMFLRNASQMSYRQLLMRRALQGERVRNFMQPDPVTVTASMPLDLLVEDYVYKYHYKMFPVLDNCRLIGCVTTAQVTAASSAA